MAHSLAQHLTEIDAATRAQHQPQVPGAGERSPSEPGRRDLAATARHYLRCRRRREGVLAGELFADPAWDLLLDLFACASEGKQVTVSDACIAANVPASTALRWLTKIESCGLIARRRDPADGRRTHLELTPEAERQIAQWLRSTFHMRDT